MNNNSRVVLLKQRILCISVTAALSLAAAQNAQADIYRFTYSQPACLAIPNQSLTVGCAVDNSSWLDRGADGDDSDTAINESSDAFFTMLQSDGFPLKNNSEPYFSFHFYWYGWRTPIGGELTLNTTAGTGVATINSFDFYGSGPAVASSVTMVDVGNGDGIPASGDLWLGQMLFSWNGNNGIPVSIVWNMSGLMSSLSGLTVGNTISGGSGIGVVAASENMIVTSFNGDSTINVGELLIATTTQNSTPLCTLANPLVTGQTPPAGCMTVTPSGGLPLQNDTAPNTNTGGTGIGGSPMIDGPFVDFNANFDFKRLTLGGYIDLTAPSIVLGSNTITVPLGGSFNPNNPGVTVTCTDNADGTEELVAAGNANISFTVDNGNGGTAVNANAEGTYQVGYTCTDNASVVRGTVPGAPAPSNLSSSEVVLTVTVSDTFRPVINISGANPLTHQACTAYTELGGTVADGQETISAGSIVITGSTINAATNEGTFSKLYNVSDTGSGNPGGTPLAALQQTRTVNVVDSAAPVLTVAGGTLVNGFKEFTIEETACAGFNKPTASVIDANGNCNAPGSSTAISSDAVTCVVTGTGDDVSSTLSYSANDTAATPNTGTTQAVIIVQRSKPVINLNGGGVVLNVGDIYSEASYGMSIHDVQDGDLNNVSASGSAAGTGGTEGGTITYTITSNVTTAQGNYTVTYNATDSDGNIADTVTRSVNVGAYATGSNFTMMTPVGVKFGGTNDVVMVWDRTTTTNPASTNFNTQIFSAAPREFNGYVWTAHHVRIFGPGDYTFDTSCTTAQLEAGTTVCNNPLVGDQVERYLTINVGPGQIGAHILFDWHGTSNIDVVVVWDQNAAWTNTDGNVVNHGLFTGEAGLAPSQTTLWNLVSTDNDGDGINGVKMVDGPFIGFSANFSMNPADSGAQMPLVMTAPSTKLGSGSLGIGMLLASLFSLIGLGVYRKIKQ